MFPCLCDHAKSKVAPQRKAMAEERTENRGVFFFQQLGSATMGVYILLKILDFGEFEADFHEI